MNHFSLLRLGVALAILLCACTPEPPPPERLADFYSVEDISTPEGLLPEVGGLEFFPDGRLVACFHRGEVMVYDPASAEWSVFAYGLHDPLGLKVLNDREVLVMQRPEVTRLTDTDGDGQADEYTTVTDDFGMSGNYHEFGFGPAPAGDGSYFFSLGTASNAKGIWDELRGEYNELGRPGRMYATVPYRGWVMKTDLAGNVTPWAYGFRTPNGITTNSRGELFITDNQGDWLGTSKLFHVERGKFYGHPSSLVWTEDWPADLDPLTLPVATLDSMRTRAAVLFPHNILANSPTQPVEIPEAGAFGPFAGQLLVGEMDYPRILRVMLEEVGGAYQGAVAIFLDSTGLTRGNNRLAFAPDGSLYLGKSQYVWVGAQGMQRIVYHGGTPLDVMRMSARPDGFELEFTRPLADTLADDPSQYHFERYYYEYHRPYGSDRFEVDTVAVEAVRISEDRRRIELRLPQLTAGFIYDLTLPELRSEKGVLLQNRRLFYTLNRIPDISAAPITKR